MPRLPTPPALDQRVRGALLGQLAGALRGRDSESPALARVLAEELLEAEVDLRRLAKRWLEALRRDPAVAGGWTITALEHIASHDSPPAGMGAPASATALARGLPVALIAWRSATNLVSGTYHTTMLTHPDERWAWSAVAVNVAVARFLNDKRDFIPDVIQALQANGAPAELVAAARRVAFERAGDLPTGAPWSPIQAMEVALWLGHHEPNFQRGMQWLLDLGAGPTGVVALAGGLLGARDGESALPPEWIAAVPEADRLGRLAERLVRGGGPAPVHSPHEESQC